jgi:hypothetical protein
MMKAEIYQRALADFVKVEAFYEAEEGRLRSLGVIQK